MLTLPTAPPLPQLAPADHSQPVNSSGQQAHGTVRWFDAQKGFGFITPDNEPRSPVFVEYSYIDLPGYRTLTEGQAVTFTVERDERGLHATCVRPIPYAEHRPQVA